MMKFKTENRKAQVGEKILITNVSPGETGRYIVGDVGKVVEIAHGCSNSGVYAKINGIPDVLIYDYEYEVIIDEQPKPPKKKKKEIIAELEAKVADLETELAELREKYGAVPDPKATVAYATTAPKVTRDEIINRAQMDIESLKNDSGYYIVKLSDMEQATCNVEFHVNEAKRTVTALLRGIRTKKIRAKGFAKCAPGDIFNADIGKAIALRRALKIVVPSDYLNVPPPGNHTSIHLINGVPHREVKRKAKVGELVIMLEDCMGYKTGDVLEVLSADRWARKGYSGEAISVRTKRGASWAAYHNEYNVLEAVK